MRCGRWRARTLRLGYGPQRLGYGLTWCGRARARAAMRVRRPRAAALEPAQPIRVGRRQEPASGGHRPAAAVEVLSSPSAAACAARAHLEPALRVRVGRRHRQHVGEGRPADGAHAPPAAAWCVCVCARARARVCGNPRAALVRVCRSPSAGRPQNCRFGRPAGQKPIRPSRQSAAARLGSSGTQTGAQRLGHGFGDSDSTTQNRRLGFSDSDSATRIQRVGFGDSDSETRIRGLGFGDSDGGSDESAPPCAAAAAAPASPSTPACTCNGRCGARRLGKGLVKGLGKELGMELGKGLGNGLGKGSPLHSGGGAYPFTRDRHPCCLGGICPVPLARGREKNERNKRKK